MKNIFGSIRNVSLRRGGRFLGFGSSPEADWRIIFNVGVFLSICMVLFCAYIFIKIDKGEIFTTEPPTDAERTLDIQKLKETVSHYKDRKAVYEELKNNGTSVPDPSL